MWPLNYVQRCAGILYVARVLSYIQMDHMKLHTGSNSNPLKKSTVTFFYFLFIIIFFLHGEGPRSRCYGHTTALRLFVQPYDEDEDEQFFTKFYK
jgi:hypothetical protein